MVMMSYHDNTSARDGLFKRGLQPCFALIHVNGGVSLLSDRPIVSSEVS